MRNVGTNVPVENECDETEEKLAPTRAASLYNSILFHYNSIFYPHKTVTCEKTMGPFLQSLFTLSVLPLLAGQDRQAAVWGPGGGGSRLQTDRTCDIWGHIYYLIYYLKAATGAVFQSH